MHIKVQVQRFHLGRVSQQEYENFFLRDKNVVSAAVAMDDVSPFLTVVLEVHKLSPDNVYGGVMTGKPVILPLSSKVQAQICSDITLCCAQHTAPAFGAVFCDLLAKTYTLQKAYLRPRFKWPVFNALIKSGRPSFLLTAVLCDTEFADSASDNTYALVSWIRHLRLGVCNATESAAWHSVIDTICRHFLISSIEVY